MAEKIKKLEEGAESEVKPVKKARQRSFVSDEPWAEEFLIDSGLEVPTKERVVEKKLAEGKLISAREAAFLRGAEKYGSDLHSGIEKDVEEVNRFTSALAAAKVEPPAELEKVLESKLAMEVVEPVEKPKTKRKHARIISRKEIESGAAVKAEPVKISEEEAEKITTAKIQLDEKEGEITTSLKNIKNMIRVSKDKKEKLDFKEEISRFEKELDVIQAQGRHLVKEYPGLFPEEARAQQRGERKPRTRKNESAVTSKETITEKLTEQQEVQLKIIENSVRAFYENAYKNAPWGEVTEAEKRSKLRLAAQELLEENLSLIIKDKKITKEAVESILNKIEKTS